MQSISNAEISDMLLFVEERINLIVERCRCIESAFKVSAKIAPTATNREKIQTKL